MINRVLPFRQDSPLTKYIIDILPEHFRIHVNKKNSYFVIIILLADFSVYQSSHSGLLCAVTFQHSNSGNLPVTSHWIIKAEDISYHLILSC